MKTLSSIYCADSAKMAGLEIAVGVAPLWRNSRGSVWKAWSRDQPQHHQATSS